MIEELSAPPSPLLTTTTINLGQPKFEWENKTRSPNKPMPSKGHFCQWPQWCCHKVHTFFSYLFWLFAVRVMPPFTYRTVAEWRFGTGLARPMVSCLCAHLDEGVRFVLVMGCYRELAFSGYGFRTHSLTHIPTNIYCKGSSQIECKGQTLHWSTHASHYGTNFGTSDHYKLIETGGAHVVWALSPFYFWPSLVTSSSQK